MYYLDRLIEIAPLFAKGMWMTVVISALGITFGTILGFSLGILRTVNSRFVQWPITGYVSFIRGTPFVVQIFIIFFIFPEWGIQLDAFPAGVLALSILGTAFICEIVAGGVKAVDRGQREAAIASGLSFYQQLRHVVVPQAMRTVLPPLVGQYVLMIKDSSIVSVIGVMDLMRAGWVTAARVPEGLLVFGLVGFLYFVVSYPLIRLSNRLEKKFEVEEVKL